MKRLLCLLPLIALLLGSCSDKNELKGTFKNSSNDGQQVFLLKLKDYSSSFEPVDSTVVKNGAFSFALEKSTEPTIAYIQLKGGGANAPAGVPFVYENGTIYMTIDTASTIKGTPMNDKCQLFFDQLTKNRSQIMQLETQLRATVDTLLRKDYIGKMEVVNKEMAQIGYDFIKENIKNKVGEFYLISMMEFIEDSKLDELLAEANPEYKKMMDDIRNINQPETESPSFIGKSFIDVSGQMLNGEVASLSDYVGKNKLVLVDFWASWCGPCKVEMPHVVKAYNKYKSKGLEIVAISLDDDKTAWGKGVKDLNMTWIQLSDLKGWQSELSRPYHVKQIPFTLLIDQNGTIVAENLRGNELESKLNELLK
ncbi:MAG: hypothetical protein RL662_1183 [Bacteroidota bacterium]|jgi:thiol-disulfide isomerase/thioredoxin